VDIIPLFFLLIALAAALHRNKDYPITQIYLAFVFCYLNLFPTISQILSPEPSPKFFQAQWIAIFFFEMPLLFLLSRRNTGRNVLPVRIQLTTTSSLIYSAPWLLLALLALFWIVAIGYNKFFIRLDYSAFREDPNSVPTFLLFPYRVTIEGSYFIILYLIFSLRLSPRASRHRGLYRTTLWLYLLTFSVFFFVNSRMQFLLLLLCLYFIRPGFTLPRLKAGRMALFSLAAIAVIIALTLIRELFIESNDRLDASNALGLFYILGSMISDRINSLVMLARALEGGYNPFGVQSSGLLHLYNLYFSFFADPEAYAQIRASEITSPSVEIINRVMGENYVDFPKSMVLDIQLVCGSFALPFLAGLLAAGIRFSQKAVIRQGSLTPRLLAALFLLPLLLQFEKEFLGFVTMLLKLSPLFVLLLFLHGSASASAPVKATRKLGSASQLAGTIC